MLFPEKKSPSGSAGVVSRRNLIKTSAALAATFVPGTAGEKDDDDGQPFNGSELAYIGTYTPNG